MERNMWRWEERREREENGVDFIHYYNFVFLIFTFKYQNVKWDVVLVSNMAKVVLMQTHTRVDDAIV